MREKLIELLIDSPGLSTLFGAREEFAENADWLIANDVVPVVRCKDCKWWGYVVGCGHYCRCNANQMADTVEDDFCSYGERKRQ